MFNTQPVYSTFSEILTLFLAISSKSGIFIGTANLVNILVIMASPLSKLAIFLLSSDKSWAALCIRTFLSDASSFPRIIFVLMLVRISGDHTNKLCYRNKTYLKFPSFLCYGTIYIIP